MHLRTGLFLLVSTLTGLPSPALAQNWQAVPRFGTIPLSSGFEPDPWLGDVEAGGSFDASAIAPGCVGFIDDSKPDLDLDFKPSDYALAIYAVSEGDASLVVFTPSGEWLCADDTEGTNPAIVFDSPLAGNYNIWVGAPRAGDILPAVLGITETDPDFNVPVPLNTPQADNTRTNSGGGGAGGIEWGDDTSQYSRDGECDDGRFAGPGASDVMLDEDRYHDATDCRAAYLAGRIYLR